MTSVRRSRLNSTFYILLVALPLLLLSFYLTTLTDDAYIAFRYARNVIQSGQAVYNLGEYVEGYTSPLWVGVLAVAGAFGADIAGAAAVIGIVCGVSALFLTYRLAIRADLRSPFGPVLLLATNGMLAFWMGAGLETPLFVALILLAILLTLRSNFRWAGIMWGLVYLCRPEGAGLFFVTLVWLMLRYRKKDVTGKELATFAALGMTLIAIHVLWRLSYYGYPLPNTFYAKVGDQFLIQAVRGIHYVLAFLQIYGIPLVAIPAVWSSCTKSSHSYLALISASLLGYVVLVGGDGLYNWRFILPVLPLLYILAIDGWQKLLDRLHVRLLPALVLLFCLTNIILGMLGIYGNAGLAPTSLGNPVVLRKTYGDLQLAGEWLQENLPSDSLIAVTAAGYLAYFSQHETIDMLGLNDAHIAHADIQIGSGRAGHEKFDVDYVLRREPDIIVPLEVITDLPLVMPPPEYLPVEVALWEREDFHRHYAFESITLPDGRWLNLYVRK